MENEGEAPCGILGEADMAGFGWEASSGERAASMERMAWLPSESEGLDAETVACTDDVESSAAGSEDTRDRPLKPLTVGIQEFESVLLSGDVARRCLGDVGGDVVGDAGVALGAGVEDDGAGWGAVVEAVAVVTTVGAAREAEL